MTIFSVITTITPIVLLVLLSFPSDEFQERYLGTRFIQGYTKWPILPIIKSILGFGVVRFVNLAMNSLAHNNWRISSSPPSKSWDWPNEIAVVTGGCGGIGMSLVEGLTAKGVRVAVLDVADPPPSLQTNERAFYFKCDITSFSAVAETADAIRKTLGGDPSILINNAGLARRNSILDAPEASLRKILSVNLLAMWFTTKAFLPAMIRENKGHVVTVASLASFFALSTSVEYSATKAGALAFHEGLACEIKNVYHAPGVITTIVHPDFVRTPMTEPFADVIEKTRKMMSVEDVSRPVLNQIFSGRGAQIVVPKNLTFLSSLRGWPSYLQEGLRDVMGKRK